MRTQYMPVPIGGWNASIPVDLMPPTDAETMVNFIPDETSIKFRAGSESINSGSELATEVETLATHRAEDGTETLLAFADDKVYSVNTSTGVETQLKATLLNNRWQTVNFNNLLLCVNGEHAPQQYDGTTFGNYASAVSGATGTDLNGVMVFKGRAIYWENNSAEFWYAASGAYGGALTSFPLAVTTNQGGYVLECCSWTRDSGDGVDDLFVVLMSTGETLVYSGSNPSSNFSLVGRFNLGAPISIRGSCNLASDRIIVTKDGFVNLSTALQVARVSEKGNVSTKIIDAAKKAASLWGDNYGWEIFYHDKQSLLMVNVPRQIDADPLNNVYEQYCMNTNTGAWCRFKGWNAISFAEIGGELYMGGSDGEIRKCFTGTNDDDIPISYILTPAFSNFGMPDRNKQLTYITVQTNFVHKDNIGLAGLSDFETQAFGNASVPDLTVGQGGTWDTATWDVNYWDETDINSPDIRTYNIPVSAFGYSLSCKMKITTSQQTANVYSFRYKYKIARTI